MLHNIYIWWGILKSNKKVTKIKGWYKLYRLSNVCFCTLMECIKQLPGTLPTQEGQHYRWSSPNSSIWEALYTRPLNWTIMVSQYAQQFHTYAYYSHISLCLEWPFHYLTKVHSSFKIKPLIILYCIYTCLCVCLLRLHWELSSSVNWNPVLCMFFISSVVLGI